ncbi:transglycosylase family protein [Streptomyces sp. NPDC059009]|uniref:transglycosylase family protein n=1 Tax=Streptomyces sp. NPDC059009 TaxID=3346694 RepID=UPI0036BC8B59
MLSGNGRHRRPRQAPALVVAAGVAGSAIAIPLLGATSASAADAATWDRLAECESGASWSANEGNGYYGGLQFSQEVWENYGGLDYAPSADQASRSQQIAVGEKVLKDQGPDAWPSCSAVAGLTQDGTAPDVDPGAPTPVPTDSSDPSDAPSDPSSETPGGSDSGSDGGDTPGGGDSAGDKNHDEPGNTDETSKPSDDASKPSEGSAEPSDGASEPADDGAEPSPSKPSGSEGGEGSEDPDKSGQDGPTSPGDDEAGPAPAPSDSTPSSGGRHRGGHADEGAHDGAKDRSGRHASRGQSRDKDAADGTYTVRPGDSLSAIADDLDVHGGWPALYDGNKKAVGADPDLILPGQRLDLGEK